MAVYRVMFRLKKTNDEWFRWNFVHASACDGGFHTEANARDFASKQAKLHPDTYYKVIQDICNVQMPDPELMWEEHD